MSIASRFRAPALGAVTAALLLAGCATPTAYAPATRPGGQGYSELQIEPNRFRVTFNGNSLTSRETVERFLLVRAAQLTVERGYDYFEMAARDTEKKSRTYVDRPFYGGPYGFWGPSWRYYGPYGWRAWDPFWGDPFFDRTIDVRTINQYEATAEIVMGRGPKPANNPRAFDARAVLQNLGPQTTRPV